jgi:hypothetical protein
VTATEVAAANAAQARPALSFRFMTILLLKKDFPS